MTDGDLHDGAAAGGGLTDDTVQAGDLALAVRRAGPSSTEAGALRPVLLVHGLASNARLWDGVTRRLGALGHPVVAVDQRGHGRSPAPDGGYDTDTCADDLARLVTTLGWTGGRAPVVAGQSWGGNVVLSLAARHGAAGALALVDGGWIRFGDSFATFDEAWAQLAPPSFDGMRWADLRARIETANGDWPAEGLAGTMANLVELPDGGVRARLSRDHHRDIVRSMWAGDPRLAYPRVTVPVLAMPAGGSFGSPTLAEALAGLPDVTVSAYEGAHHDLHAQHPERCAHDLHDLAARADAAATEGRHP